jgi:serine/threonine protein kinase
LFPYRDLTLIPRNFLYNPDLKEGVLVDFGLAEVSLVMSAMR